MTQAQQQVSEMQLDALFDGECSASERAAVEAQIDADADVRAQFEELGLLRQAIVDSFEAEAAQVPEARFEQIWDEIERTIDRDSRLQQAADEGVSIWSRLAAMLRPVWRPALAVGGVAAAAVFVLSSGRVSDLETNNGTPIASKSAASDERAAVSEAVENAPESALERAPEPATDTRLADASPAPPDEEEYGPFPAPNEGAAEIEQIEFGGNGGRIGQLEGKSGTVTVIWVTEDEDPADSERAL